MVSVLLTARSETVNDIVRDEATSTACYMVSYAVGSEVLNAGVIVSIRRRE